MATDKIDMRTDDWSEGRYLRQRRNLNAMSIALLVYVVGGGSVSSGAAAQLPGGLMSISLQTPVVVIVFAWVSLLYFMWRYWLSAQDLRGQIKSHRQVAYHWTPYVRQIVERTVQEHNLLPGAHGMVEFGTGWWSLKQGRVRKNSSQEFVDIPDQRLPIIPFLFISWWAEIKAALVSPEFSEFYTPFFLAWLAIMSFFVWPAL